MRRSLIAAVAAGVLSVGVVAAGGWYYGVRHGDGPLGESGLGNQLCLPVGEAKDVTVGYVRIDNNGSSPVTITGVSLIGARGVEDAGALLLPEQLREKSNTKAGWAYGNGPWDREAGQPNLAVDATVPAKSKGRALVVHLQRGDVLGEGYLTGVRVEYRAGLRRYAYEVGPETTLRPGKCF
ncbi:hypothetical protein AB0P21_08470 [Kribbella sp. NPDC056861]|uniref:hypothetical protein n=1 Tax=Kribbella sp. NPDC056861 TaxID=3154857 RepID=UPI00343BBADE